MLNSATGDVRLRLGVAAILAAAWVGVYVPKAGCGFVLDDFEWAMTNRVRSVADVAAVLRSDNGFYRPVVGLTFSVNEFLGGTNPKPYGITNVLLALACGAAIAALCRGAGVPPGASLFAAGLWLFNPHAINMAVLWISGRTALLLTLFATMSAAALVRGRLLLALAAFLLALFSKEEAIVFPVVGAVGLYVTAPRGERSRKLLIWGTGSGLLVLVYLVARGTTDAMTPASAPPFYRFTFEASVVLRNLREYSDRALTVAFLAIFVGLAVLGVRPRWSSAFARIAAVMTVWLISSLALTLFLPVRSSLYALLPSVAGCVLAASVLSDAWARSTEKRQRWACAALLIIATVFVPIHVSRTHRYVQPAEFSTAVLNDLAVQSVGIDDGTKVVLHDDRTQRVNLDSTFGALLDQAFLFHTGRRLSFWIEPPAEYAYVSGLRPPCAGCPVPEFRVLGGRAVREK